MRTEDCFVWILFILLVALRCLRKNKHLREVLIANLLFIGTIPVGVSVNEVQLTRLDVPRYVAKGDNATLVCEYNQTVVIYSIKWYRNDREFFHYIPTMIPSKRDFKMPGINVDTLNSNGTIVILRDISLDSEGRYKCEVSAEWPKYTTADKSATMEVVVIPKSKPNIYGAREQYRLGDNVRVTCVSEPSKPKARLTWYINDKQAGPENLEHVDPNSPVTRTKNRLTRTELTLKFKVSKRHFANGKLTIRCSARISPMPHRPHYINNEIIFNVPVMIGRFPGFNGSHGNGDSLPPLMVVTMVTGFLIQVRWFL